MKTLLDRKGGFTFPHLHEVHAEKFKTRLGDRALRHKIYSLGASLKRIRLPKASKVRLGKRMIEATLEERIMWGMVDVVEVAMEIATLHNFQLGDEFARHYPNECCYCREPSCICHTLTEKPKYRYVMELHPAWSRTKSFTEFQEMLWRIYPKPQNREGVLALTVHLGEELMELLQELDLEPSDFVLIKAILEAVDVAEKALDIASLLGIPLAPFIARRYNCR